MDKRLTPEVIAALKGIAPVTGRGLPFIPAPYLRAEVPAEVCPTFFVRSWTQPEVAELRAAANRATRPDADADPFFDEMDGKARLACAGWENLLDLGTLEESKYSAAPDGGADRVLWNALAVPVRMAVYEQARIVSGLQAEEKTGFKS